MHFMRKDVKLCLKVYVCVNIGKPLLLILALWIMKHDEYSYTCAAYIGLIAHES